MRLSTLVRPARRVALVTAALVGALTASSGAAAAQTISATYAPTCAAVPPGGPCDVRFGISNTTGGQLDINTLTFISGGAPFLFAPTGGGAALYQAVDVSGEFGGIGTVSAGGTQFFINFLDTGLPFSLAAGGSGYVELGLTGSPDLATSNFQFSGTTANGTIAGRVLATSTVPEPATLALLFTGLAVIGGGTAVSRRRSAA